MRTGENLVTEVFVTVKEKFGCIEHPLVRRIFLCIFLLIASGPSVAVTHWK